MENNELVQDLLLKMADDAFIIGHRNSEWIGIGPTLEEDISFGSLAQDKVGHAYNLYQILEPIMGQDPDKIAFVRAEKDFKCCHFVELPNEEYDLTLIRHFLFDHAESVRYEMLKTSSNEQLAGMAKKFSSEIKYHIFHANTWVKQLALSNDIVRLRLQSMINRLYPFALGIFEPSKHEDEIIASGLFGGEKALSSLWTEQVEHFLNSVNLTLPKVEDTSIHIGGRNGYHTEHLQPLLTEMREVFSLDTEAGW